MIDKNSDYTNASRALASFERESSAHYDVPTDALKIFRRIAKRCKLRVDDECETTDPKITSCMVVGITYAHAKFAAVIGEPDFTQAWIENLSDEIYELLD